MKLRTLKREVKTLQVAGPRKCETLSDRRMTGRKLQDRRLRLWSKDPRCAHCGRLTDYPSGFELDHRISLFQGGEDTDENCQVLCVWYQPDGSKQGCHAAKTAAEAGPR